MIRFRTLFVSIAFSFLCALGSLRAQTTNDLSLELLPPNSQGWLRLNGGGEEGMVYSLFASSNLFQWQPIATLHDGIFGYADPASPFYTQRYYRALSSPKTATNDWKNQVRFPIDPFLSEGGVVIGPDLRWIKFAIPLQDPVRVYYQDSAKYAFHHEFARARLEAFRNLTPAQFDQIALYTNNQQVLLGSVLVPPPPHSGEYGIQFVGTDVYSPEFIDRYFELVRSTVAAAEPGAKVFYVPAFEQARAAETNRNYFESKGIQLTSADRWISGDHAYSTGWALGRLKFIPGSEISQAFAEGRLQPQDILLTDGVPAEIPILAGMLSLTPSTPNSHVAILARSYGLPFAYLADPAERTRVQQLDGKDIVLRVEPYTGKVKVTELDTAMTQELREEILNLKKPPVLEITAKTNYGAISASTDNLTPADLKYFGGKASNFGFLRRKIPNRSHQAIGISFDLWDAFLDQVMPGGQTLRAQVEQRLSKYSYPPNMAALKQDLEEIRTMITGDARFTDAQKQTVIAALQMFDPKRNIRFRSSTNVEDSEQFSGAGLYDSYSGCLQDDLDNDASGPCHCDPTEDKERGVFRAIQKVYASFYNDNAFLERLRHKVDESTVGMALLVHHSTPDEIELANGVATLQAQRGGEFDDLTGDLVTQKGAVSVTNPDGNARPEVVSGYKHEFGVGGFLSQRSSLVPLGGYVMDWQTNYIELMNLFSSVADAYHEYFPHKKRFILDFEYKKVTPGVLDVKQVREVPVNNSTNPLPAFLLNTTNRYWVMQGEAGDVFSNHRLKSFWQFQTKNIKLTKTNLAETFFTHVEMDYLEGREPKRITGSLSTFPNASHAVDGNLIKDQWSLGTGAEIRDYQLQTEVRQEVMPTDLPVLDLNDFTVTLAVNFATPQPALGYDFDGLKPVMRNQHFVMLEPRRTLTSTNHLQQRTFTAPGVNIQSSFYWPAPPSKGIGDKTAPLVQWRETRIEGLTAQPIVLRGEYSQTYRPGHHNFSEEFIFEPTFESGLATGVLQELQAANVQFIHVLWNGGPSVITILGVDGKFRELESSESPSK